MWGLGFGDKVQLSGVLRLRAEGTGFEVAGFGVKYYPLITRVIQGL